MGEVYRAHDAELDREVALKVLPDAVARDADRLARFRREARALAALNHPNIAVIHGLAQSGEAQAIVMELVEGRRWPNAWPWRPASRGVLAAGRQIAQGRWSLLSPSPRRFPTCPPRACTPSSNMPPWRSSPASVRSRMGVSIGSDPMTYVFTKAEFHTNLFQIPLRR